MRHRRRDVSRIFLPVDRRTELIIVNNHINASNTPIRFTVTIERGRQQLIDVLFPSIREQGFEVTGIALLGDIDKNGKDEDQFNTWLLEVVVKE